MEKKLVIAIDGYSSCGKSTFAKAIARELNYIYIDSGAMYRAVTLYCLRKGLIGRKSIDIDGIKNALKEIHINFIYNPDTGEYETWLNSENVESEIRNIEVSDFVSRISQVPEVRTRMVELQRQIGVFKGVVMDGRDIGTVVFPDADIKIFMTASIDVRAERRYRELRMKGQEVDYQEIKRNITERDRADETRAISPLKKADDAVILDNSEMSVEDQMRWIREIISEKKNAGRNR
ncbi:MAG TPA: (d)CMP kinase [Bacteroidales bacterium]|nr:(d)CMP kinase [Bacteroidales bacterium]HRR93376.1 (d)CMP kinase [Bacteroidales bacterium]HRT89061.1 (d)CMP kinase [Bacteroidales bacterium]